MILQLHRRHRPVSDLLRVEDVQPAQVLAGVVCDDQDVAVVLVIPAGLGREDGLLQEGPLAEVIHLLVRFHANLRLGVELDQALVGSPLDVVLHRRPRAVREPVRLAGVFVVNLRKLHHPVAERRLLGHPTHHIHVEPRVLHPHAAVVERGGDRVQVHREVHVPPGRGIDHHPGRVVAPLGLEGVHVVKEELVIDVDGLLANLPRLVRPREHVQLSGLALLERDDLRQRALREHVLADKLLRVELVRVLEEQVPVLGDEAVVEHAEGCVGDAERVPRSLLPVDVPLVEAALVGLQEPRLALDGERHQPLLRRVLRVDDAVVRSHLGHLQGLAQHHVRLALGPEALRVHLVGLTTLPQRVQLPGPVHDARVGDVLDVKIERVVEGVALGVADGERALVEHLPRGLLVGESLGADEVVLERELAVLKGDRVHQPVAVEELVEPLAEDLEEARAVPEEGAAEVLGDRPGHPGGIDGPRGAAIGGG